MSTLPLSNQGPPRTELNRTHFPGLVDGGDGKELQATAAAFLVRYATAYGLDAWQGHVVLFFGQPFVTEKGAIANAQKYGKLYRGFNAYPMTPLRLEQHGKPSGTYGWECEVLQQGRAPLHEWGFVEPEEISTLKIKFGARAQFLPIVKHPGTMARARAVRRAHILAFPLQRTGDLPPGAEEVTL